MNWVTDWLSKHGISEIDGPMADAIWIEGRDLGRVYKLIEIKECGSEAYARRVLLRRVAEYAYESRDPIVVWRQRPLIKVDEFGLWTARARLTTIGGHDRIKP